MKRYFFYIIIFVIALLGAISIFKSKKDGLPKRVYDFNFDWKFALVKDSAEFYQQNLQLNWQQVRLPHDWSVEHSFDSINGDGATAYLPGGRGMYQKEFDLASKPNQTTYINFDGVYNHAEVWLNGEKVGVHPNGYAPFYYDISEYLNENGKDNLLEVKVDRSRYIDSRWYPGSGIYRNVKLIQVNDLHIPIWGTFITTPEINERSAEVSLDIKIRNNFVKSQSFELLTTIINQHGQEVAKVESALEIDSKSENEVSQTANIPNPEIWDIDAPVLYTAITSVIKGGGIVDQYETRFGIREFHFDKDKGFFLNGENRKIKGVCLHHDGGLTGSAVPTGVWRRRLAKLKEAGCNAIRISHNPASDDFLDLCDEMGFLVQEEFFDEWDYPKDKRQNQQERHSDYISRGYAENFQEWAEKDLKSTMLRSRNHPSIFQWSIGNEIEWTYPRYSHASGFFNMSWDGNYFWEVPPISTEEIKERYDAYGDQEYVLANTANKLATWTRELDMTRPVIANCILPSVSHESGYADALDIVGYSYRRVLYNYGHENYPDKVIMGTENLVQWHEWKSIEERPFIAGTFFWTGIDYMGEAHGGWPSKGISCGMLDLAGFEKPSYQMIKSLWNDDPHIAIASQTIDKSIFAIDEATGQPVEKNPGAWKQALWTWHDVNEHWNYQAGETTIVEVYTNCESAELFLNNQSLGTKKLANADDHILKWVVPYQEGNLRAVGIKDGKNVSFELQTAYEPVAIRLKSDKLKLSSDAYDVAHIVAQFIDKNGNPVKHVDKRISFSVDGDAKIIGVDNGAIDNVQDFQSNELVTSKGRALMIIQSNKNASKVYVKAVGNHLESNVIKLEIQ